MITRRNYLLNSVLSTDVGIFHFLWLWGTKASDWENLIINGISHHPKLDESVTTINEHLTRYLKAATTRISGDEMGKCRQVHHFVQNHLRPRSCKIIYNPCLPAVSVHQYVSGAREAFLSGRSDSKVYHGRLKIIQERNWCHIIYRVKCSKKFSTDRQDMVRWITVWSRRNYWGWFLPEG